MLNIVWYLAAVGADIEASIFTDSALVEQRSLQCLDLSWERVVRSLLISSFSEMLINGGQSSNTTFFRRLVRA